VLPAVPVSGMWRASVRGGWRACRRPSGTSFCVRNWPSGGQPVGTRMRLGAKRRLVRDRTVRSRSFSGARDDDEQACARASSMAVMVGASLVAPGDA
jgi:hypothetical protein